MSELNELENIINYIDFNYTNSQVNINYILDNFEICYSSLYEKFYYKYKMSPQKYIETKRLNCALKQFLKNKKIIAISFESGYSEIRTFRTAFKKRLNITPLHLKKILNNRSNNEREIVLHNLEKKLWNNDEKFL